MEAPFWRLYLKILKPKAENEAHALESTTTSVKQWRNTVNAAARVMTRPRRGVKRWFLQVMICFSRQSYLQQR